MDKEVVLYSRVIFLASGYYLHSCTNYQSSSKPTSCNVAKNNLQISNGSCKEESWEISVKLQELNHVSFFHNFFNTKITVQFSSKNGIKSVTGPKFC